MPRINETAVSSKDLFKDGAMGVVRYMQYQRGLTYQEIRRELHRRYPNATNTALNTIIGHAQTSKQNATAFNRANPEYKLERERMSPNPSLLTAYRYVVNVKLTNPRTGEESFRIVVVDSSKNLTKEQVTFQASFPAREQFARGSGKDRYDMAVQPQDAIVSVHFISVECRTC